MHDSSEELKDYLPKLLTALKEATQKNEIKNEFSLDKINLELSVYNRHEKNFGVKIYIVQAGIDVKNESIQKINIEITNRRSQSNLKLN